MSGISDLLKGGGPPKKKTKPVFGKCGQCGSTSFTKALTQIGNEFFCSECVPKMQRRYAALMAGNDPDDVK